MPFGSGNKAVIKEGIMAIRKVPIKLMMPHKAHIRAKMFRNKVMIKGVDLVVLLLMMIFIVAS
jgi:hypothetical protein